MNYFKQWKERLWSPSPDFFKPIIKWGMRAGGLGGALVIAGDSIPALVHTLATYLCTAGVVAAFVGGAAKQDAQASSTEQNK